MTTGKWILLPLAALCIVQLAFGKPDVKVNCGAFKTLCECRKESECRWHAKTCKKPDEVCKDLKFTDKECRRENGLYAFSGSLCFTKEKQAGKCAPLEAPLSVNCGGNRYTDYEGATYEASNTVPFDDPLKIAVTGLSPDNDVKGCRDFDKAMYRSYIQGTWNKPAESDSSICIHYKIPIKEPGEYEVTVRMLDPESTAAGQRSFNMKLNARSVIREIDLFSLAKMKSYAVNVRISFRVTNDLKTVVLKGHKDTRLHAKNKRNLIPLSFCNSDCKDQRNVNFIISAIRVMMYNVDGGVASPGGGVGADDDDDTQRSVDGGKIKRTPKS